MQLAFRKYHGLGNDFIVVSRLRGGTPLSAATVRALCDRHRGIGADGVLSLWPDPSAAGRMQIQNADGSEALMCGNGLRCMARSLYDENPNTPTTTTFRIGERTYACDRLAPHSYRVDMGVPLFDHADLPESNAVVHAGGLALRGVRCWLGNPHWVLFSDALGERDPVAFLQEHGADLSRHPTFRVGCNVSIARARPHGFQAVVYERGAGMTQACGSGATAVGVAAVHDGRCARETPIHVELPGGELIIRIHAAGHATMEGDAQFVYEGRVEIGA